MKTEHEKAVARQRSIDWAVAQLGAVDEIINQRIDVSVGEEIPPALEVSECLKLVAVHMKSISENLARLNTLIKNG